MIKEIILSCSLLLGLSCRHKPVFDDFPVVSYSQDIGPMVAANCTQSGCHGTLNPESFLLSDYNSLIQNAGVKPGQPENSKLYMVVTSYKSDEVMPRKPYKVLTENQVELLYVWIGQGAKNN